MDKDKFCLVGYWYILTTRTNSEFIETNPTILIIA